MGPGLEKEMLPFLSFEVWNDQLANRPTNQLTDTNSRTRGEVMSLRCCGKTGQVELSNYRCQQRWGLRIIIIIIIKIKNNINIKSKPVIVFHCCWPFWIQKWVYAGSGGWKISASGSQVLLCSPATAAWGPETYSKTSSQEAPGSPIADSHEDPLSVWNKLLIIHHDAWWYHTVYSCYIRWRPIPAFCSTSRRQDPPPPPEVPRMPKAVVSRSEWFPDSSWELGIFWCHDNWAYHPLTVSLLREKVSLELGKWMKVAKSGRKHQENDGNILFRAMDILGIQGAMIDECKMPELSLESIQWWNLLCSVSWGWSKAEKNTHNETINYCMGLPAQPSLEMKFLDGFGLKEVASTFVCQRILISSRQPNCTVEVLTMESAGAQLVPVVWLSGFPHWGGLLIFCQYKSPSQADNGHSFLPSLWLGHQEW